MKVKELEYGVFLEIGVYLMFGGLVYVCLDGEGLVVNFLYWSKFDFEVIINVFG